MATLTGAPTGPNPAMNLLVTVGSTGVVSYRYALDGDVYSAEAPTETPIERLDITPGSHNLHVLGRNTSGTWQGVPTEQRWELVPGLGLQSLYELMLLQ